MYSDNLVEKILDASNKGKDIILSLYPNLHSYFDTNKKFRMRDESADKTPSASLKLCKTQSGMEYWGITDFGDSGHAKNAIGLFAEYYNIDYKEAIDKLAEQYNIGNNLSEDTNKPTIRKEAAKTHEKNGYFKMEEKNFSAIELAIWGPYVTADVLKTYGWHSVLYYSFTKEGETTTIFSNDNYPIFARDLGDGYKIYSPYNVKKDLRFMYRSKEPGKKMEIQGRIFGIEQAKAAHAKLKNSAKKEGKEEQNKLDEVIICSGERDAMNLAGMGYLPIWFGSETATLTSEMMKELYQYADKVYNIPDLDTTGIEKGKEKALKFLSIYTIELPESLGEHRDMRGKPCKDFRDFCELYPPCKGGIEQFERLKNKARCARFWDKTKNGYKMNTSHMLYFLQLNGFYKWRDPYTRDYVLVRVFNNYIVQLYDAKRIRDYLRHEILERSPGQDALEAFLNSRKTTSSLYEDLEEIELNFKTANEYRNLFFFQNGCFAVTAEGVQKVEHPNCYVWKDKINPHKFITMPSYFEQKADGTWSFKDMESCVYRYTINSCRMHWRKEFEQRLSEDPTENEKYRQEHAFDICGPRLWEDEQREQYRFLLNRLFCYGYLLHNFKSDKMAMLLFLIENKTDNEDINAGGSGKTMMIKVLERLGLLEIVYLDGRDRTLIYNSHYLDRVTYTTDMLYFDDLDRRIDMETFYTMVDSGLIINPKGCKSFRIPFKDAPNLVFSSNSVPNNMDPSTMRRIRFVQFSDYYHSKDHNGKYKENRRICDDFGGLELFGPSYTEDMCNADINFLLGCLQFYLINQRNNEYCNPPMEDTYKRIRRKEIGENELDWFRSYFIDENRTDWLIDKRTAY